MEEKCIICGKPAKYVSKKFISPLCEDCAKKEVLKIAETRGVKPEFVEVDDYYTQPCTEMENINKMLILNNEENVG